MSPVPTPRALAEDPLWVPLLTHYRRDASIAVDRRRMAAHVRSIRPQLRQFLLAGSTGDGWEFTLDHLLELARLARDAGVFDRETRLLFGLLRRNTEEAVQWAAALERNFAGEGMPAAQMAGFAVCPPVDAAAGQEAIRRHYERVLEATTRPIAVYELPQVTGCSIAPETLRALARNPRIIMFKDSGGVDTVARAGAIPGVVMLRGAEGGYAQALRPQGPYDGWLLSTANVFAADFRRVLALRAAGEADRAQALSDLVARQVAALFAAAQKVPFGNAFSNANRAGDHLLAHGRGWQAAPPPLTVSGQALPRDLLDTAAEILARHPGIPERGYLRN